MTFRVSFVRDSESVVLYLSFYNLAKQEPDPNWQDEHLEITESHPSYFKILEALKTLPSDSILDGEQALEFYTLLHVENLVEKAFSNSKGAGKFVFDKVTKNFYFIDNSGNKHCLGQDLLWQKLVDTKPDHLVAFFQKLYNNPLHDSILDLYRFLESSKLPILPDGDFLAYKVVASNYRDLHSGKFDNTPGKPVEMNRQGVNPNREVTCSTGLHVCSPSYLSTMYSSTNRIVIVKVSPTDVVSVPLDYHNSKVRCCKYYVLDEITIGDFREGVLVQKPSWYSRIADNVLKIYGEVYKIKDVSNIAEFFEESLREKRAKILSTQDEFTALLYSRLSINPSLPTKKLPGFEERIQEFIYKPFLLILDLQEALA
ncbi:hypothetical protein FACS189444_1350 [Spirochaetia bacterium]|nr:hypothetical protein FACS189444_1350 [Spirochaetia bacterium]